MKIVVCDDDALVYEQMKNIIASYSIVKNENLELTFYQTVEELLHAKHKYDILFLDIRFNNCDIGIDVAKKLRKAGNTSLIILLTSLHPSITISLRFKAQQPAVSFSLLLPMLLE